jgi:hypothetical protein
MIDLFPNGKYFYFFHRSWDSDFLLLHELKFIGKDRSRYNFEVIKQYATKDVTLEVGSTRFWFYRDLGKLIFDKHSLIDNIWSRFD